jgi:hypothetical protein
MHARGFDFEFLGQQLSDGVIVEDTETLADLAILVPSLLRALEEVEGMSPRIDRALQSAREAVLRNAALD